jgi:hypothetical protein
MHPFVSQMVNILTLSYNLYKEVNKQKVNKSFVDMKKFLAGTCHLPH